MELYHRWRVTLNAIAATAAPAPIPALAPELREEVVEAGVLSLTTDDAVFTLCIGGRPLLDVGDGDIEEAVEAADEEVLEEGIESLVEEEIEALVEEGLGKALKDVDVTVGIEYPPSE